MKVNGYCFDHKKLIDTVNGYSSLSPYARHALRDIFDMIWGSVTMSVPNDATLVSYTGFSKTEWVSIVNELVVLNRKFIMLIDNRWRSPWLESQKGVSLEIQNSNPLIEESFKNLEDNGNGDADEDFDDFEEFSPVGADRDSNLKSGSYIDKSIKRDSNNLSSDGFSTRAKKINERLLLGIKHRG